MKWQLYTKLNVCAFRLPSSKHLKIVDFANENGNNSISETGLKSKPIVSCLQKYCISS